MACISGEKGEVQVKTYNKGDFFGEIALLLGEPRKAGHNSFSCSMSAYDFMFYGQASIYAKGEVTCLVITKAVFDRVPDPCGGLGTLRT